MSATRSELRLVYSVSEAAELLGIGRSTAYELVARGELPTLSIGSRHLITRPTLTALLGIEPPLPCDLDRCRTNPAKPAPPTQRQTRPNSANHPALPFSPA